MASTSSIAEHTQTGVIANARLLVSLSSLSSESLDQMLAKVASAFPGETALVATPDRASSTGGEDSAVRVAGYTPSASSNSGWTLTAADFLNAYELASQHKAQAVLLLGAECQSLSVEALQRFASAVLDDQADLAMPCYALPARAGLVNSAILYPTTRALFGVHPRFPLAIDLGMSMRMAARMAATAQRFTAANQLEALLWPVAEASVAGFKIAEIDAGERIQPAPDVADLNSLLAMVAGSMFSDLEAKAAYWQRARTAMPATVSTARSGPAFSVEDTLPMLESFRLAYSNLHEIWSLVLPPQTQVGLKRLAAMPAESFRMPDSLWARIIYDFLLAYRLRTINRGHLMGALTPLYLAWVASHILLAGAGTDPERHVEQVAMAFEADKAYLVSRWRWPDRFNP